jgi:transcriptional regulator with XRE-family HTH domain
MGKKKDNSVLDDFEKLKIEILKEKVNEIFRADKENNISIIKLAEMAGVSRQTVNDWINCQVPKGNHLIFLCKIFNINPDYLFSQDFNSSISVPVHRVRKKAKVTPDIQKDALDLAMEYDLLFRNAPEPGILTVMRGQSRSKETAKKLPAISG